jgi:hypothetical protein
MSIVHDPNYDPSSGAGETWVIEYYKHPAPPALRSEDADSNELLFVQPSIKCHCPSGVRRSHV